MHFAQNYCFVFMRVKNHFLCVIGRDLYSTSTQRCLSGLRSELCKFSHTSYAFMDLASSTLMLEQKKGGLTQTVPTTLENCLICLVKMKLWAVQYFCPCSVPASLPSLLFPRKQWKLLYGKIKSQRKFTNIICESNPVW